MKGAVLTDSKLFSIQFSEDSGSTGVGYVPFAELFNHSDKSNARWGYDRIREGFVIYANSKIKKGEEICINYGQKPCRQVFAFYGFISTPNIKDDARLIMNVDLQQICKRLKITIPTFFEKDLESEPIKKVTFDCVKNWNVQEMKYLLSLARFVVCDDI